MENQTQEIKFELIKDLVPPENSRKWRIVRVSSFLFLIFSLVYFNVVFLEWLNYRIIWWFYGNDFLYFMLDAIIYKLTYGHEGEIFTLSLLVFGLSVIIFVPMMIKRKNNKKRAEVIRQFAEDNGFTEFFYNFLKNSWMPPVLQTFVPDVNNHYELVLGDGSIRFYEVTISPNFSEQRYTVLTLLNDKSVKLPHIFLDSKNNGTNFNHYEKSDQVLLEGDFNDYFDVYLPSGGKSNILSFLSPETMQLFKEEGYDFDIELNNNGLSIIASSFNFNVDAATRMFNCLASLNPKLVQLKRLTKQSHQNTASLKRSYGLKLVHLLYVSFIFIAFCMVCVLLSLLIVYVSP